MSWKNLVKPAFDDLFGDPPGTPPPLVAANVDEASLVEDVPMDEASSEDARAYLKGLLEALLFVSDHPLTMKELARAAKIDKKRTEELIAELRAEHEERGIRIEEVAG